MIVSIDKNLLFLSAIFLIALFMGTHALDGDSFMPFGHDHDSLESIHEMAKRRFLPTRSEPLNYIPDFEQNLNSEDESHLNAKRYFLKSKRYFLKSKRSINSKDRE